MSRNLVKSLLLLMISALVALLCSEWYVCRMDPFGLWQRRETKIRNHPSLAFVAKPFVNVRDDSLSYMGNAAGLRNRETPMDKPPGRFRVLVLGPSSSYGLGLRDNESWPAQLEYFMRRIVPGAEVINASIPGYTTFQEYLLYKQIGRRYRPDLVLLWWVGNEMATEYVLTKDDIPFSLSSGLSRYYETEELRLSLLDRLTQASFLVLNIRYALYRNLLTPIAGDPEYNFRRAYVCPQQLAFDSPPVAHNLERIRQLGHLAAADGTGLAVVYYASLSQLGVERMQARLQAPPRSMPADRTAACARSAAAFAVADYYRQALALDGIPVHNLGTLFAGLELQAFQLYRDEGHLTSAGSRLTALALLEWLLEQGRLDHVVEDKEGATRKIAALKRTFMEELTSPKNVFLENVPLQDLVGPLERTARVDEDGFATFFDQASYTTRAFLHTPGRDLFIGIRGDGLNRAKGKVSITLSSGRSTFERDLSPYDSLIHIETADFGGEQVTSFSLTMKKDAAVKDFFVTFGQRPPVGEPSLREIRGPLDGP